MTEPTAGPRPSNASRKFERVAFWLMIAILAWAPFALGSNRAWSWSLLSLLVGLCWLIWAASQWDKPQEQWRLFKRIGVPMVLGFIALTWGWIQTISWVPSDWIHPIWPLAADALDAAMSGAISLDPWRTITALMKFITYGAMFWLVYAMTSRAREAQIFLTALIFIGTFYASNALLLGFLGMRQFEIFYSGPAVGSTVAGPFVLHNSFATYMGLITLCGLVQLFSLGARVVVISRGIRPFVLSITHFLFGTGVWPLLAVVLSFSMLIASTSRAGFLATITGVVTLLILSIPLLRSRKAFAWAALGTFFVTISGIVLFQINGANLEARFDALVDAGSVDPIRLVLWDAAQRMIGDAPFLGLGLGTYEAAYPLYATEFYFYSMDKAHNDYLELAAGWGLPATCAWLLALISLVGLCARAIFIRRRNRVYPLLALGASALVAFHSAFDFSLQIPAVALTYAAILGLGVAQAFPTDQSRG